MERLGIYSPDFVFSNIGEQAIIVDGWRVKMCSSRYVVFRDNQSCIYCGITGSFFALERNPTDLQIPKDRAHFNFYAMDQDGNEVLMTKDHLIPQSKSGSNRAENLAAACLCCNNKKGNSSLFKFQKWNKEIDLVLKQELGIKLGQDLNCSLSVRELRQAMTLLLQRIENVK